MNVNLSIKAVPESIAERLRQRAERNHRSLQGELMAIIASAAADESHAPAHTPRSALQGSVPQGQQQGWMTIEDLVAERRARPFVATPGLPLAVDIIRADRDSR